MENKNDEQNILKSEVDSNKYPKLAKAKELAENYKIRAEKAEAESKELKAKVEVESSKKLEEEELPKKPQENETPKNEYSLQDIRALGDVHDDDVESVVEWAKFKKISIAEAKKTSEIQTLMREKTEERATAEAANTGGGKRVTSKTTIKELLKKAEKGDLADLDDDDFGKIAEARLKAKMSR